MLVGDKTETKLLPPVKYQLFQQWTVLLSLKVIIRTWNAILCIQRLNSPKKNKKKHQFIYQLSVMHMARRKNPYFVVPLKHGDIIDYKQIRAQKIKNVRTTVDGKKVNWTKIRWRRVQIFALLSMNLMKNSKPSNSQG